MSLFDLVPLGIIIYMQVAYCKYVDLGGRILTVMTGKKRTCLVPLIVLIYKGHKGIENTVKFRK